MAAGITAGALLAANDAGASTVLHPGDVSVSYTHLTLPTIYSV